MLQRTYFIKQTRTRLWTFRKSGPSTKIHILDKSEGPDFKYDNRFLKFQPENTQSICGRNFRHFYSFMKRSYQKNSRTLISIMKLVFSYSSPKIPKSDSFSPKFNYFHFCTKLYNKMNSRALILRMTIVFQSCAPKHLHQVFLAQI